MLVTFLPLITMVGFGAIIIGCVILVLKKFSKKK